MLKNLTELEMKHHRRMMVMILNRVASDVQVADEVSLDDVLADIRETFVNATDGWQP